MVPRYSYSMHFFIYYGLIKICLLNCLQPHNRSRVNGFCYPIVTLKKHFEHVFYMSDKNQEFQKNVSEQAGVKGQRKEVNVGDYPRSCGSGSPIERH
jgi:hypothetical protein